MDTSDPNNSEQSGPKRGEKVEEFFERVAVFFALLGGFTLLALVVLKVIVFIGRWYPELGMRPIPFEFELIQTGATFAFFAFLPWCLLQPARITFDSLVRSWGLKAIKVSTLINNILVAFISSLIFGRMFWNLIIDIRNGTPHFVIEAPRWWFTLPPTIAAFACCFFALYCVWRSPKEPKWPKQSPEKSVTIWD